MRMLAELTMEQTFIVTGIVILVAGVALGFLVEWIFRKENERNDERNNRVQNESSQGD